jgi:dipeptidyl aminopeptidase/acylaminoacyl peptidase
VNALLLQEAGGAREKLVEFRNRRGKWLRGMMHFPASSKDRRAPGVVFFHGFTGDRMESHWIFIKCARALARAGIASLRFDFYGSGESEGEFRAATLAGEIADAVDAVKFFRRQRRIDRARLGLCGLSLGGCVAACIAQRVEAKALVTWSAVAHPAVLQEIMHSMLRPVRGSRRLVEYDAREVSLRFVIHAPRYKPVNLLAAFRGPTLIIHPGEDEHVPRSHAEDLYQAAGSKIKQKAIIPGADHTFASLAWEREVIQRTVAWFRAHL